MPPDPIPPPAPPDIIDRRAGRPGGSGGTERVDTLRSVVVGALLVIAAGLVLDAPADLSSDQRVLIAGLAGILAVLIGLSASVYRGRS